MKAIAIKVWLWLAVLLPALFGVMVFVKTPMMIQIATATGLAHQMGIRQIVYAAVLLISMRSLGTRATAVVILGRGLTDLADGVDAFLLMGPQPALLLPIITGAISLLVAWSLARSAAPTMASSGAKPA